VHPLQLDLTHAGALIALCWPAGRAYPAIASSISSTLVGSVRSPPGPSLRPSLLSSSEATETKRSLSCIAALHSKLRFRMIRVSRADETVTSVVAVARSSCQHA